MLLSEDLESVTPRHFDYSRGTSYKSFITVPVRAGSESYGILTIDSDRANSLTEVDRGYVVLLAGVLAAGIAHNSRLRTGTLNESAKADAARRQREPVEPTG